MLHADAGSMEFDVCPACFGVWLDGDELRRFVRELKATKSPVSVSRAVPQEESTFLDPQVAADHNLPCQICGTRVSSEDLGWHAGFYKCKVCFVPQTTEDSARLARLRKQNLEHWRELRGTDNIFENSACDVLATLSDNIFLP